MTITPERASRTLSDLIAEEIRVALTRQRMSQRQFAAKLGVSTAWLNYRLTGVQEIGVNDLNRIAKALDLTIFDLMPPPDAVAQAATSPSTIPRYLEVAVFGAAQDRPRDNRPPARSGVGSPDRGVRTAYLGRGPRGRRD